MQNRVHNHRLLGAIVLLSLAVIFLPMLFGQRDDLPQAPEGSTIPRADEELETLVFQLNEQNLFQRVTPLPGENADPPPAADGAEAANEAAEPVAEPEEAGAGPAEGASASAAPRQALVTWMVQLGSFSKENNARALRDRLRGRQYAAHLDRVEGKNGAIWRVRVGPELSRERAEKLRRVLEQETGLKGLVIERR